MNTGLKGAATLLLVAGAMGATGHAQQLPPQIPSAGQLLQQVPQQPLREPRSNLDLRGLQQPSQAAPQTRPFLVRSIQVTGNTLLAPEVLRGIVGPSEGRELTLEDLYALANRISEAYHKAGYPLARAYVPAQTVQHGDVRIAVIEARYGAVELHNQSKVATRVLDATMAPLKPGEPVANGKLERTLLLLSDIPGARVSSAIKPGAQPGTSDLVTDVTSAPRYFATAGADDYGNRYTGRVRLNGNLQINGPLNLGDMADLGFVNSAAGMNYVRGGYQFLLNGQGTTLRAGGEYLNYHLGRGLLYREGLGPLGAHGSAAGASLTLTQPIIRSTAGNLYGQLAYDHRTLEDAIDIADIHNDRDIDMGTVTLAGDQRDRHGVTNYRISGAFGNVRFTNAQALQSDQASARTNGGFGDIRASLSRLQQLTDVDAIYLGYTVQWAGTNLDSSQQFFLGGPNTIPGYDTGTFGGSEGTILTAEYRRNFTVPLLPGVWQAAPFVNTGHLKIYENTYGSPGDNRVRVYSGGARLDWAGPDNWTASAAVAAAFGPRPPSYGTQPRRVRFWLQFTKGFDFG